LPTASTDNTQLVLRPGPNFDLLLSLLDNPATAQHLPTALERSPASDGGGKDGNPTRRRPKRRLIADEKGRAVAARITGVDLARLRRALNGKEPSRQT